MGFPQCAQAHLHPRAEGVRDFQGLASSHMRMERRPDGRVFASSEWLPQTDHSSEKRRLGRTSVSDPKYVPEAWPALLSREQLSAYVGMSREVLSRVLPVRPLDVGINRILYNRAQIDQWLATLPVRGRSDGSDSGLEVDNAPASASRTEDALERVRARAGGQKL